MAAVDAVLQDRRTMVERLLPLVDPDNAERYDQDTFAAAVHLLGELRAIEAVPVLSEALTDPRIPSLSLTLRRFSGSVVNALIKIGQPVVPAMLENVKHSDDREMSEDSLDVLIQVLGGKQQLLNVLRQLERNTVEQPDNRQRIQQAIDYTRQHYDYTEDD